MTSTLLASNVPSGHAVWIRRDHTSPLECLVDSDVLSCLNAGVHEFSYSAIHADTGEIPHLPFYMHQDQARAFLASVRHFLGNMSHAAQDVGGHTTCIIVDVHHLGLNVESLPVFMALWHAPSPRRWTQTCWASTITRALDNLGPTLFEASPNERVRLLRGCPDTKHALALLSRDAATWQHQHDGTTQWLTQYAIDQCVPRIHLARSLPLQTDAGLIPPRIPVLGAPFGHPGATVTSKTISV